MIPVALFDLDDTLLAHRHAVDTGIVAHVGSAASDPAAVARRWFELEELHYHRYLAGEVDFLGQRRARSRAFVEPYGIDLATDAAADSWYDAYYAEYVRAWRLHDDALPCLDELSRAGIRLGVITNGERAFQEEKLAALGILERFEHVIASGDAGVAKPDAGIFRAAAERFGVEPALAAYVGDRLETDAVGAANAGLTGVWLDRAGAGGEYAPRITSLAELPGLMRS